MTEHMTIDGKTIAYDVSGQGPLVVLAHGIGDSRHSYRFLAPALVRNGYRVANVDLRGCGDSDLGWDGYSRTDIAGDLVALVRHLGGPAVLIGHSISGGAATIAAAQAPDLVAGVIELAPFTRAQSLDLGGLFRVKRFRAGYLQLALVVVRGRVENWKKYLDVAIPAKPSDWDAELARIESSCASPDGCGPCRPWARAAPGTPARSCPTSSARSSSSRAVPTPTGPTPARRARRSSRTCPRTGRAHGHRERRALPARADAGRGPRARASVPREDPDPRLGVPWA